MKILYNTVTKQEVFANGVSFLDNATRLNDGSTRPAPALWTDNAAEIASINDKETTRLKNTDEFSAPEWELRTV